MECRKRRNQDISDPLPRGVWLPARIILVHNASSRQFDSHEFHRLLTAKYEQSNFRGSESIGKSALRLVAPTRILRTVAPTRRPNAKRRTREHLTPGDVETLIEAAKVNRYGHWDAIMILVAFRQGLRAAEVCDLRWDQIDFSGAVLHVRRVKSKHPLLG